MPPLVSEWKQRPALRGRPQYRRRFKHNVDSDGCTKRLASGFMGARRTAKAAIKADYESDFGDDGFVSGEGWNLGVDRRRLFELLETVQSPTPKYAIGHSIDQGKSRRLVQAVEVSNPELHEREISNLLALAGRVVTTSPTEGLTEKWFYARLHGLYGV